MAYDPAIPALGNYIGDDIAKIRENFVELAGSRIVEMGSNSNGEYVRWGNGLQICWRSVSQTGRAPSTRTTQSLTVYRDFYTWSFPAAFSVAPMVLAPNPRFFSGGSSIAYHMATGYVGSVTVASAAIIYESLATFDAIEQEALLAVGRWK